MDEIADQVLVLRLPKSRSAADPSRHPGKRFGLEEDGSVCKRPFNRGSWFSAVGYAIADVDGLHGACERARLGDDGGPGYVVAGALAPEADPRSLPRSKTSAMAVRDAGGKIVKRGRPVGLVDAPRHWQVLDLDHVPSGGIDPRRDPRSAIARLRGLLPPAIADARVSWQWSASTCVKGQDRRPLGDAVPSHVGAHLRFWCDVPMSEADRKLIQARLDAYVDAACPGASVDTATAIYNQAIFCCASYEDGLADPFPGSLRSGLADGRATVSVADLLAQLPECPGKAPATSQEKAQKAAAGRAVRAEWREHDAILKGAARQMARPDDAVVRPGFVRRDPLRGAYGRGKAERIAWRQQVFRERALADIVKLTSARRAADPKWADGVPDGRRRRTMLAVTALLSWLVPADAIEYQVGLYAARLVGEEWYRGRYLKAGWGDYILDRAREAGKAVPGAAVPEREDRCKAALMNLMMPSEDEQVGLGLRALRGEMARSTMRRAEAGTRTEAERRAEQTATSARSCKPWDAEGISRATWYGRKRAEAAAAGSKPAQEPRFTADGLELIAATLDAVHHATSDVIATALGGFGLAEIAETGVFGRDLGHAVTRRGDTQPPARRERLHSFGAGLFSLATSLSDGTPTSDSVRYLLDHPVIDIAGRGAGKRRERVATRADLLVLAAMHATTRSFAAVVRLWSITGQRPIIVPVEPIASAPAAALLTGRGTVAWAPEAAPTPPAEMPPPASSVPDPGDPFGGAVPW